MEFCLPFSFRGGFEPHKTLCNLIRICSAVAVLCCSLVCRGQDDHHLAIDVAPVRWQLLPPAVKSVCVGPDGRVWYTVDAGDWKPSDGELRAALEMEYRAQAPQIKAASLALFEPGGRVWFKIKPEALWGYDGETWIERATVGESQFTGECPTRGQVLNNLANRVAGGRTWLRDSQGVHIYDGQEWTYAVLCPPGNTDQHLPRLTVSPSGKYAVAMAPSSTGQHMILTNPELWFWEEDNPQWVKRSIVWGYDQNSLGGFCVTDEAKLWCSQNGTLRVIDLIATKNIVPRMAELIEQLDNDDAARRQKASETLAEVAEQIQPQLAAAQKLAATPEKKRRLDALLERAMAKRHPALVAGRGTSLGNFLVHAVADLYQDDRNRMVFSATISAPDLPRLQNAIIAVDRNGKIERLNTIYGLATSVASWTPIFTSGGSLWTSGASSSNGPARRIDLRTFEATAQTTDLNYPGVLAVDDEGRAYLHGNYFHLESPVPVGVFNPRYPDTRPSLKGESVVIQASDHLVASDGKVWAVMKDGLSRCDGQTWELIHPASRGQLAPVLAGREGLMLCRNNNGTSYFLFEDNQLVAAAPLRRLIETYPDKFATAFPPSFTPLQHNYRIWIATDSRRNIWLLEQTFLAVLSNGKWISGPDNPRLIPGLRNSVGTNVMTAVGSGGRVFFSTSLAELNDGTIVVTPAPECVLPPELPVGVRDNDGAFWLPAYVPSTTSKGRMREHYTIRLGEEKPLGEFGNNAWPMLADQSGNVWLARMGKMVPPRPRCHFWLWRDGRVIQEIQIPMAQDLRGICSDKPGSAYVWTSMGLHHLVAGNSAGATPFAINNTYTMPSLNLNGNAISCSYSPLVGLVIPTQPRNLTFVALPSE